MGLAATAHRLQPGRAGLGLQAHYAADRLPVLLQQRHSLLAQGLRLAEGVAHVVEPRR